MPRNPHAHALAKRRGPNTGTLNDLLRTMWQAVHEAKAVLVSAAARKDEEVTLKAVHAVIQAGSAYAKLLETSELETRLAAVEQAQRGRAA